MVENELRRCNNCRRVKPISEFYRSAKYHDYKCKSCRKQLRQEWYHKKKANNPEHFFDGFKKRKIQYAENKNTVFVLLGD